MSTMPPVTSLEDLPEVYPYKNPPVLLRYQADWVGDRSDVKFGEKGRRIGLTWAQAADDVLLAATQGRDGMDVMYISYNLEITREYIACCAYWAKHYDKAVKSVGEFIFEDEDPDKHIKAFRIVFASGHEIVALSSRPTTLRGRQGRVVIDEAAFVESLAELLKAALAFLMWGGQVVVISTHDGDMNEFNQLIQDIRAGKWPYSLHRYTFDDALADGLYKRICLCKRQDWSPEAERVWREKVVRSYGADADEELFCIPSQGSGAFLTRNLIEACMQAGIPVLRWAPPAPDFVDWPEHQRKQEFADWLQEHVEPLFGKLRGRKDIWKYVAGWDFARSVHLSVFWPSVELTNLNLETPFVVEFRDAPFSTQEEAGEYFLSGHPRFAGAAFDARGNGQALAEKMRQKFGPKRIAEVMESEGWYREVSPVVKAQFEDRTTTIPRDAWILDDLRALKWVKGVAQLPPLTSNEKGQKRHGDSAMAKFLCVYAAKTFDFEEPFEVRQVMPRQTARIMAGY